jgi:class 3 adenylate cyclase
MELPHITVDLLNIKQVRRLVREHKSLQDALFQSQEAAKRLAVANALRDNVMGRIAVACFGDANNVPDEQCVAAVERLARVAIAARALAAQAEEYELDCGLGRGAPNSWWEDLDEALDEDEATS